MNTTNNIVNFNNTTINVKDVIKTYIGTISQIKENRYIYKCAFKSANGKERHEITIKAKFIMRDGDDCYQGWEFNADDADELEEFKNIGFKLGQKIIWYYMKNGENKFELVNEQ